MKVIKKFTWALLLILCSTTVFVGCSDDDDEGKNPGATDKFGPSAVFTDKKPKTYGGLVVAYNADGLVKEIKDDTYEVTFTYQTAKTKASNAKQVVRMTVYDTSYPEEGKLYLDMTIGGNGFVESCKESYEKDNDVDIWSFGYNKDGQLNYMKRSENGNRVTTLTYINGDVTEVKATSDSDSYGGTLEYGENPKDNKGNIMMFDVVLGVDMDEMGYAYVAGLLGKATKHLPVKFTDSGEGGSVYTYEWTLDDNGYPKSAKLDGDIYNFTWQ